MATEVLWRAIRVVALRDKIKPGRPVDYKNRQVYIDAVDKTGGNYDSQKLEEALERTSRAVFEDNRRRFS